MFDPQRMLGQMLGESLGMGGLGGGKRRRKSKGYRSGNLVGKAQLGIGLLGVAMAAWEHYQSKPGTPATPGATPMPAPAGATAVPPPPPAVGPATPPPPPPAAAPAERDAQATALLRAMIAAAHADGRLDEEERAAILQHAADPDDRRFLEAELAQPRSLEQVIAATPVALVEDTYAACLIAIRVDTDEERAWLDRLAKGLRLTPDDRTAIHSRLGLPA